MNIKYIYGWPLARGPLSDEVMAENQIDEQVQIEPAGERALELQALYGYTPGRGIQAVDFDPQPPSVTVKIFLSALEAADDALADPVIDEAGLRAAFVALRAAILA